VSHPIDLLVSLEDGTLSAPDRAILDGHLATCDRCSAEVAAATAARTALRALATPPAPEGMLDEVLRQIERPGTATSVRDARSARWQRIAGVAGAAAAVVLIAALALPNVGDRPPERSTADQGLDAAPEAGSGLAVEVSDDDLSLADVPALAAQAPRSTGYSNAGSSAVAAADAATPGTALECLQRGFRDLPGDPIRLIQARFDGEPAYLGVFLIGPGAGQDPTDAKILIASIDGCRVLGSSQVNLPP
jgi:anti-sigma factor RsiW